MIKLIVSQLGMLTDQSHHVDFSALQACLQKAKQHHARLMILSASSYPRLLTEFQSVNGPLDYGAENGAETVVNGVNIREKMIDAITLSQILDWLNQKSEFAKAAVTLSSRISTLTNAQPDRQIYRRLKRCYPTVHPASDLLMIASQIYQIRVDVPVSNVAPYQKLFRQRFSDQIKLINGGSNYFYVVSPEVDWGSAVASAQKDLGVRNRQMAAFGKSIADFNYLNAAKYSFAAAGANPALQAVAKLLPQSPHAVFQQISRLLDRK